MSQSVIEEALRLVESWRMSPSAAREDFLAAMSRPPRENIVLRDAWEWFLAGWLRREARDL